MYAFGLSSTRFSLNQQDVQPKAAYQPVFRFSRPSRHPRVKNSDFQTLQLVIPFFGRTMWYCNGEKLYLCRLFRTVVLLTHRLRQRNVSIKNCSARLFIIGHFDIFVTSMTGTPKSWVTFPWIS